MPPKVVQRIVCYSVYSGVHSNDGCSYENSAMYDDWDSLVIDMKAALDADLQVMVEPALMTLAEHEAEGQEFPETVNPLLGESKVTRAKA